MPTHHDETLLERYQREHREFEGMNMNKAEELANMLDDLYAVDERPIDKETSIELRRLSAINAELIEALKAIVADRDENANGPEKYVPKSAGNNVSYWSPSATMVHSEFIAAARAAIAKAQGEQP